MPYLKKKKHISTIYPTAVNMNLKQLNLIFSIIAITVNGQKSNRTSILSKLYKTFDFIDDCVLCNTIALLTDDDEDNNTPIESLVDFHCVKALVIFNLTFS